jgi:hypothetical protein
MCGSCGDNGVSCLLSCDAAYLNDYLKNYMECVVLVEIMGFRAFCHVMPLILEQKDY